MQEGSSILRLHRPAGERMQQKSSLGPGQYAAENAREVIILRREAEAGEEEGPGRTRGRKEGKTAQRH